MTHETYENLRRVLDSRIRQAAKTGRWDAVAKATAEREALDARFAAETSLDNPGGQPR